MYPSSEGVNNDILTNGGTEARRGIQETDL